MNQKFAVQSLEPTMPKGTLIKPNISDSNQRPKITHFQYHKNIRSFYVLYNLSATKTPNSIGPVSSENCHIFILNTKPFLTDFQKLRYLENISWYLYVLSNFLFNNLVKSFFCQICFADIPAPKYWSEMICIQNETMYINFQSTQVPFSFNHQFQRY